MAGLFFWFSVEQLVESGSFFFSSKPSAAIGNYPLNFSFLRLAVLEELTNECTNKLQTHRLTDSLLFYRKDGSGV